MLDESNQTMNSFNLPSNNQDEIRHFMKKTEMSRKLQEEFDSFMDQISPSLKLLVQRKVFEENLTKNNCVANLVMYYNTKKKINYLK